MAGMNSTLILGIKRYSNVKVRIRIKTGSNLRKKPNMKMGNIS
jgi:hypothetical protein